MRRLAQYLEETSEEKDVWILEEKNRENLLQTGREDNSTC